MTIPTAPEKLKLYQGRAKLVTNRDDIGKLKIGDFVRVWRDMKNPRIFVMEITGINTTKDGAMIRGNYPYITYDNKLRWSKYDTRAYWNPDAKVFVVESNWNKSAKPRSNRWMRRHKGR